jgi:2-keto-4-pentenoate hydratase
LAAAERWLLDQIEANRKVPELREAFPEADADDGYRLQFALMERRLARGERVIGYKAAFTAKAMQAFFGVGEPCSGVLASGALITTGRIAVGSWIAANAEPEIAFLIARPLQGPGVTIAEVMAATEGVLGALEIGNLRTGFEKRSIATFLGLNTLNGGLVLGDRIVSPSGLDLRLEGAALEVDGQPVGSGTGVEALGDPRAVVAWIANLLARYGRRLEPGHVVITGSLVQGPLVRPGQHVRARFTHLGEVEVEFVE